MSIHRKVHSHGSIPFSWEDKPGVCKTPLVINHHDLKSSSSSNVAAEEAEAEAASTTTSTPSLEEMLKIPLPPYRPCGNSLPPQRSFSGKGIIKWQQEDPFLVAYKHINNDNNKKMKRRGSRSIHNILWCKSSSDVKEGNLVKLSSHYQIPRLPSKTRSLTLGEELKRDFNYQPYVSLM